jgi:HEAT repeats
MSARRRWMTAVLLAVAACAGVGNTHAATLQLPRDGWVSWDIDTVADAPAWCCFEWNSSRAQPKTCQLDSRNHGYGSSSDQDTVDTMRVYARFNAGRLERLRALATTCPVQTLTPVRHIDGVASGESIEWLNRIVAPHTTQSDDALAALAVHRGTVAAQSLQRIAKSDSHIENRKQAMFWATQVRGEEGLQMTLPFLTTDPDAKVREHAAFAVAQTKKPSAIQGLIRQGREDASTQVRAQAWFWLAQTAATEAETAIRGALSADKSRHVRDQAVFALSQLPEPRNVTALVRIAEDSSVDRDARKQALFWLGQSESDEALKYLDRLLGDGQSMAH